MVKDVQKDLQISFIFEPLAWKKPALKQSLHFLRVEQVQPGYQSF